MALKSRPLCNSFSRMLMILLAAAGIIVFWPVRMEAALAAQAGVIPPFRDVLATKYQDQVGYLSALGIIKGRPGGLFEPRSQITRAEMAALALRSLGPEALLVQGEPVVFTDVPGDHWASAYIAAGARLGIFRGFQGQFRPGDPVTYAEMIAILLRMTGQEGTVTGGWPFGYLQRAAELKLAEGTDFTYNLPAIRGDVALMLTAAIFKVENVQTGLTLSQRVFKVPDRLEIKPPGGYYPVAAGLELEARGYDWYGRQVEVSPRWEVTGPARLGSNGMLWLQQSGEVTVTARQGEVTASATYRTMSGLKVVPSEATVTEGARVKFTAVAVGADGSEAQVTPAWRVASGPGTIDGQGNFTARSGQAVLEAQLGMFTASARVNGTGPPEGEAVQLKLSVPATILSAELPQPVTVTAALTDDEGNLVPDPGGQVIFKVTNSNYLNLPAVTSIPLVNGQALIQVTSKNHPAGGNTVIIATTDSGLYANVAVNTERRPVITNLQVSDITGTDAVIGPGEEGAKVIVTLSARLQPQDVEVYVNGVKVTVYPALSGNTPAQALPAGGTFFTGYIRDASLGVPGTKEVRAAAVSSLGRGSLSTPAYLDVTRPWD